jgi:transposase-like protein
VPLSKKQIRSLEKVISIATELLNSPEAIAVASSNRKRRSGKDLVEFRKKLIEARTKGASVAELAKEHGVSPAYVYQLPSAKKGASKKVSARKKTAPKKSAPKKVSRK